MDKTEIAAWWGAVVATAVLLWDVYKWLAAGPRLRVDAWTGRVALGMPEYRGKALIQFDVSNIGDRSTTITNAGLLYYGGLLSALRGRPDWAAVIAMPSSAQPLPFELRPGAAWTGLGEQTAELERLARSGRLYAAMHFSHRRKPIKRRLTLANAKPSATRPAR